MCWERIECRIESTQIWVAYEDRVPTDEDAIRIYGINDPANPTVFDYGDFGNPQGWNAQKLENARIFFQEHYLDLRIRVADLPNGHWAKDADPGLIQHFWEWWRPTDQDPFEWWFVERTHVLERLTYSDAQGLAITMRWNT